MAGLKFCPYCGTSQNLAATAAVAEQNVATPETQPSTQAMGDHNLKSNEDKTVVEDDAYDMMSHLPLIRPLPRLRSRREVMGSPLTRTICYIIIVILLAIFFFILYLFSINDEDSVLRSFTAI